MRSALLIWLTLVVAMVAAVGCDDEVAPTESDEIRLSYVSSDGCGYCRTSTLIELKNSDHPYKLNKVIDGNPPIYPFSEVPSPPEGVSWDEVSYVIGGFGWKARFIGLDGTAAVRSRVHMSLFLAGNHEWCVDQTNDREKANYAIHVL